MQIGSLLRVILPFDEETSSSDQSTIHNNQLASDELAFQNYPSLIAHKNQIYNLRGSFCSIRRLVRIKLADQADYKQVSPVLS